MHPEVSFANNTEFVALGLAVVEMELTVTGGAVLLRQNAFQSVYSQLLPPGSRVALVPGFSYEVRAEGVFANTRVQTAPKLLAREAWGPALGAFAIVPDDDTDLAQIPDAVYIGGPWNGGTLRVITARGDDETFNVVQAQTLPLRIVRVMATGTTATGIKGLY